MKLKANKLFITGFCIVVFMFLFGLFAPLITENPYEIDISNRLSPPSLKHPFGTDQIGRDLFSRIIYGTRTSLLVALSITIISMIFGSLFGSISGYFGGIVDDIMGRIIDIFLSIPDLVLNIALVGILSLSYGTSPLIIIFSIAFTNWVGYARIVRGSVLSIKECEFIMAARAIGANSLWILIRHITPNILGPIIVLAALNVGNAIIAISSLGFLGLGIQPPTPEWGEILNSGKNYLETAPWIMLFSGFAIAITVLGFNLLGEGLRDILDVKKEIIEK